MGLSGIPDEFLNLLLEYAFPILPIIITVAIYLAQRKTKSFTYQIISENALIPFEDDIKGKLDILYQGNLVEEVYLVLVNLANSGNVPIPSTDFEDPVIIEFNKDAQILSNDVTETQPKLMKYTIHGNDNKLKFDPTLMNQGDYITIQMLISKYKELVNVHGRIIGVSEIKQITELNIASKSFRILGIILIVIGIVQYFMNPDPLYLLVSWVYAIIGLIIVVIPEKVLSLIRKKRRNDAEIISLK